MSASGPTSESHFGKEFITEEEWTITIKEQSQLPTGSQSDVSIFRVPNILMKENRKAYIPQRVSLGPYHHRSAELRAMDSHKGRALSRMMTRFNNNMKLANDPKNMEFAVRAKDEIVMLEDEIKKRYEEEINCDGETLALMLSLDGSFILEILRTLRREFKDEPSKASKCYEPIFEPNKIDFTGGDILEDILKLENQIPLIVLQKLLELELNWTDAKEKVFEVVVNGLRNKFYPFKDENIPDMSKFLQPGAQEVHHILGFWHSWIVSPPSHDGERVGNNYDDTRFPRQDEDDAVNGEDQDEDDAVNGEDQDEEMLSQRAGDTRLPHQDEDDAVNGEDHDEDDAMNGEDQYEEMLSQSAGYIRLPLQDEDDAVNGEDYEEYDEDNDEEFNVLGAVELANAGIKFKRRDGGIKGIRFDTKSATIYLPHITINDSTEVLFRNLIAFEMCSPFETKQVACYVHLMDQIIDSEEDVALLIKNGIVTNFLGSNREVANVFNGLCNGVTLNRTGVFKKLPQKVNKHYKDEWKVQFFEFVKEHFSSVWKALAWAGAFIALLLTIVQTIFAILAVYK